MKIKKGFCVECGEEKWLANNAKKLCQYHNNIRKLQLKKEKRISLGQDELIEVYRRIWASRPHISFLSGESLEYTPKSMFTNMFAHVLAKGLNQYPKFKYYDKNIILLSPHEHLLLDHGTEKQRTIYQERKKELGIIVDWNKIFELRDELKEEYASRYVSHKFGKEK